MNADSESARTSRPFQRRRSQQNINPTTHPQFKSKQVCTVYCRHCTTILCRRGMKAILLGDTQIELFSTDLPPSGVQLVYKDYSATSCSCRVRDAACLGCGNVVGYHVTQPCSKCLEACNNGHFWMFLAEGVAAHERTKNGSTKLKWKDIPQATEDTEAEDALEQVYEQTCR